jgi:hypothetical protein
MAKRRPPESGTSNSLPDELKWSGRNLRKWRSGAKMISDDSGLDPSFVARFSAVRRHRDARQEFLNSATTKPNGVGEIEFLMAHGFSTKDRGTTKVKHLGC